MVIDAPKEKEAVEAFLEFCGKEPVLLAHNAPFDTSFIQAVATKACWIFNTYLDTVPMCRAMLPGIKNHKLDTVAKHLKLRPLTTTGPATTMVLANIFPGAAPAASGGLSNR